MKVSGAVAMADHVEAFGIEEPVHFDSSEEDERVANAIAEAMDIDSDTMFLDMARAAIKAIRAP